MPLLSHTPPQGSHTQGQKHSPSGLLLPHLSIVAMGIVNPGVGAQEPRALAFSYSRVAHPTWSPHMAVQVITCLRAPRDRASAR